MKNFFQIILFQAEWLLCVLNIRHSYLIALIIFFTEIVIRLFRSRFSMVGLVFLLGFVGIASDTLLMRVGVFSFPEWGHSAMIPIWLITLWGCFSLWYVKADFINQQLKAYTLLCVVLGPLSYYAGMKLGAITMEKSLSTTLFAIAANWFLLGIIFVQTHKFLMGGCRRIS